MWPAAKTYMPKKHEMWMDEVTTSSPEVKQWLEDHHNLLWAKSKFDCAIKCEYINNNLAESWNSWIKDLKDLPVDALADAIREKTLILFEKRRISRALNGVILPAVINQLNKASKGLGHLKAAYACVIPNITDKKQWPQVDKGYTHLPPMPKKRGVGRQRKNRIPSTLEKGNVKGKGKATRQVQCPECGGFGHRKGSAKCELTGTKKRKRNKKRKTKVGRKKAKGAIDAHATVANG
ncbi:hypothetical protein E2562_029857 [Oryza meyeriana var. granulata]|uniref:Uncharacterized protein n=1 Tax=Oryza meyeriana var. granulata TaxID=110450 RepID=A0A6G1ER35_9ORYZ|nr:hypothetical protein E2562_029857 [Oryza meyeriana var. granulata]